ncbi:MAG: hypothetical protein O8C56_12170 [Candidatus Methanoperedens sp.]|nr:hypothetical protein [Candidatus Methanoperedens sp.]
MANLIESGDPLTNSILKCVCGTRLKKENFKKIPERGIWEITCPCGTEYAYPSDHPFFSMVKQEIVLMPGFIQANQPIKDPPKLYHCKKCGASITKEQALRTFNGSQGKALCANCQERS